MKRQSQWYIIELWPGVNVESHCTHKILGFNGMSMICINKIYRFTDCSHSKSRNCLKLRLLVLLRKWCIVAVAAEHLFCSICKGRGNEGLASVSPAP